MVQNQHKFSIIEILVRTLEISSLDQGGSICDSQSMRARKSETQLSLKS